MSDNPSRPLTDLERRTLHLAARKGGVTVVARRKRKDDRSVTSATANRVVLRGWATIANGTLLISKAGRAKLAEPLPPAAPVFLHRRDGLTTLAHLKASGEPEVMPDPPRQDWLDRAEAQRRLARADASAARLSGLSHPDERLRELLRLAGERGLGPVINGDLRQLEHVLARIENKVRRGAAA